MIAYNSQEAEADRIACEQNLHRLRCELEALNAPLTPKKHGELASDRNNPNCYTIPSGNVFSSCLGKIFPSFKNKFSHKFAPDSGINLKAFLWPSIQNFLWQYLIVGQKIA